MTEEQREFLSRPIGQLEISDELKALLKGKGYNKFRDVLAKRVSHLRNHEGLSFEQELELFRIVEKNNLEDFWQEA